MYSESVLNSSYVYDVIQRGISRFKNDVFYLEQQVPPVLLFSNKSRTAKFLILLSKKLY